MKTYPITPTPAPRQSRKDKWQPRPSVLRYRAFRDEVRLRGVKVPPEGATLIFVLPMPESWSKAKKACMDGTPHEQKPDLDNLEKALLDAIYGEDSHVWHLDEKTKWWGREGSITVLTRKVPEEQRTLIGYLKSLGVAGGGLA